MRHAHIVRHGSYMPAVSADLLNYPISDAPPQALVSIVLHCHQTSCTALLSAALCRVFPHRQTCRSVEASNCYSQAKVKSADRQPGMRHVVEVTSLACRGSELFSMEGGS